MCYTGLLRGGGSGTKGYGPEHDRLRMLTLERDFPCIELPEEYAQRVDVHCRVGQPPSQELRRLVAGGTNQTVVKRNISCVDPNAATKVPELAAAVRGYQHIRRLYIHMNDSSAVAVLQS